MPLVTIAFGAMEFIVTPETTYIAPGGGEPLRRIYTDGRDWPRNLAPTYAGFSIGRWVDEGGQRNYDVLEVETRGPFKGPRAYDTSGLPLHSDNRTIVKERIYLDRADHDLLHDEITTIDDALTRPWTVTRDYKREHNPVWPEYLCTESNNHIGIGKEFYFLSADGRLMPAYKDQPPPDLKYFDQPMK